MKNLALLTLLFSNIVYTQNLILDGKSIPLDPSKNAVINPVTGDIIVSSEDGNLTCSGTPPTLSITANPESVDLDGSTTISWNVTNATSCIKSGDWSGTITGNDVSDGLHSQTIDNLSVNSTFSMQCLNSFGSTSILSANVSILGNPACNSQPPILSGNEDTSIVSISSIIPPGEFDGTYNDWLGEAENKPWPARYGNQINFSLNRNQYLSASFFTDNTNAIAKLAFTTPGNTAGPPSTAVTVAISECPGDFSVHLNQARCLQKGGASPQIRWSQNPTTSSATHCILEKNKNYYLNIVHSNTESNNYSTTSCSSTFCGGIISHTNEAN